MIGQGLLQLPCRLNAHGYMGERRAHQDQDGGRGTQSHDQTVGQQGKRLIGAPAGRQVLQQSLLGGMKAMVAEVAMAVQGRLLVVFAAFLFQS